MKFYFFYYDTMFYFTIHSEKPLMILENLFYTYGILQIYVQIKSCTVPIRYDQFAKLYINKHLFSITNPGLYSHLLSNIILDYALYNFNLDITYLQNYNLIKIIFYVIYFTLHNHTFYKNPSDNW